MSLDLATASWATSATLACPAVCATREVREHQEGPAPAGPSLARSSVSGKRVGLRSIIASGPLSYSYSPECVEEAFSELRLNGEVPRMLLLRTPVNRSTKEGQRL